MLLLLLLKVGVHRGVVLIGCRAAHAAHTVLARHRCVRQKGLRRIAKCRVGKVGRGAERRNAVGRHEMRAL